MVKNYKIRFWSSFILTGPVLAFSPSFRALIGIKNIVLFEYELYLLFILCSIIFLYSGYPIYKGFLYELTRGKYGIMTLKGTGIIIIYIYSCIVFLGINGKLLFWELTLIIDAVLVERWISESLFRKFSEITERLSNLIPTQAHKLDNGKLKTVPVNEVKINDMIIIRPNEKIPVDGTVVKGESRVDETMFTSNNKPVVKGRSERVLCGSINIKGFLKVKVRRTGKSTFINYIITLFRKAQTKKLKVQDFGAKVSYWLTIFTLFAGIVTLLFWLVVMKSEFVFALERATTIFLITCGHAICSSLLLLIASSSSISLKNGIIIKNPRAFEQAVNVEVFIFNKTGTLTSGTFKVHKIIDFHGEKESLELLKFAASVEKLSRHPISKGICASIMDTFQVENFEKIPGKGVEGTVNGKRIRIVNHRYLRDSGLVFTDERIEKLKAKGKIVMFVIIESKFRGVIALSDYIRPEASKAISMLKKRGIKCMMLTCDLKQVADWVSRQLGIEEYYAEVFRDQKASKVKELQEKGHVIAMIGEGVSDASAIAQADVGIAVGTDVAVGKADIVILKSNPLDLVSIIDFAKAVHKKMIRNIILVMIYNLSVIALAAGVFFNIGILLNPVIAAFLMSLFSIFISKSSCSIKFPKFD